MQNNTIDQTKEQGNKNSEGDGKTIVNVTSVIANS